MLAVWLKLNNTEIPSAPSKLYVTPGKVLRLSLDRSRPVQKILGRTPTTSVAAPAVDGLYCAVAKGSVVEDLLAKSSLVGVAPDGVMTTW